MQCKKKWIDVFVTKPDTGVDHQPYTFDDQFACSVQSVLIDPANVKNAVIVDDSTDWIIPTWTGDYQSSTYTDGSSHGVFKGIEVGDLVRIGHTSADGHTDYLTVLEKIQVDNIYNGTHASIPIGIGTPTEIASGSSTPISKSGIAHYALRLNYSLNCTRMPIKTAIDDDAKDARLDGGDLSTSTTQLTIANRHQGRIVITAPVRDDEVRYYPLYVHKRWMAGSTLRANLDHGVKEVHAVQLAGYSVANKRQVGLHHGHEMKADDYMVLRVNEVDGHVVSNNRHANGAFAVLYAGRSHDNQVGAVEYSRFEPDGIVTVNTESTTSVTRNLTLQITDRLGEPAHFGRMHFWFKLLVTHG